MVLWWNELWMRDLSQAHLIITTLLTVHSKNSLKTVFLCLWFANLDSSELNRKGKKRKSLGLGGDSTSWTTTTAEDHTKLHYFFFFVLIHRSRFFWRFTVDYNIQLSLHWQTCSSIFKFFRLKVILLNVHISFPIISIVL